MKVILGSKSPRRKELLSKFGFEFECRVSDEDEVTNKHQPKDIVVELAEMKATAIEKIVVEEQVKKHEEQLNEQIEKQAEEQLIDKIKKQEDVLSEEMLIICADTIVAAGDRILGKPKDKKEAHEMISMISGGIHQVYTGVSMVCYKLRDGRLVRNMHSFYECTDVYVRELSEKEIEWYISTDEPYDKAGGYGIQGIFGINVLKIDGDYNNVVGLPVAKLYSEAKKAFNIDMIAM